MTEFIGSRISLISKRDIRYVGTLHEISSENSTVALEQVVSYGTEGRRPNDEVPPSLDNVYEYIVFRGSDVKDLRIEEGPKEEPPKLPKIPDDPAILGSTRKPTTGNKSDAPQAASQPQTAPQQAPPSGPAAQQNQGPQQRQPPAHQFAGQPQPHQYPYPFPPPNQRFGPQGFPPGPPGHGFPGMPYGAPPGWYPPGPYGFPPMPPGQFPPPHQMPIGPAGLHNRPPGPSQHGGPPPGVPAPANDGNKALPKQDVSRAAGALKAPSQGSTPTPSQQSQTAPPPPPLESKLDVAAALAPAAPVTGQSSSLDPKQIPTGPKGNRIVPAIPLPSPRAKPAATTNGSAKPANTGPQQATASRPTPKATTSKSFEDANNDARAAVAAAMAKLPNPKKGQTDTMAMDNLTKKVAEMRANEHQRAPRHPSGHPSGPRGGRGGHRGGRGGQPKIELPKADYDFESANAKFNKQDLVKEAIATGSPIGEDHNGSNDPAEISGVNSRRNSDTINIPPPASYNKTSSFFDNISSEIKDRAASHEAGHKMGGREFRHEELQKNMETFGQGSVDNSFRYGRGRGRGRGHFRGRGGRGSYERGRGGAPREPRGSSAPVGGD